MTLLIHHPADKFFKQSMADLRVAKEFFESHLPQELLQQVDLNSLKLDPHSFISEEFRASEADVLYQVNIQGKHGYFYLLCEHQSTVDPKLAFRLLVYQVRILERYTKQFPKAALPLIYPLVVYTGRRPWRASRDFFTLFGEHEALAREYWLQPFTLVDVARLEDASLQQRQWIGLVEFAFKYQRVQDFMAFLKVAIPWLRRVEEADGFGLAKAVIYYFMAGFKAEDRRVFQETVDRLSPELRGESMTLAEIFRDEGRQEGRQEGVRQGLEMKAKKLAVNLLAEGMTLEKVAGLVELPLATVKQLAKDLNCQKQSKR